MRRQYDDSLLSRLTYLKDYKSEKNAGASTSGWGLTSIWMEDLKSYAEAWCDSETANLYNGLVNNFEGYDGEYRFRIQGWTEMGSGVETHVICRVDQENIMKMVLRFPNGTDKDDSAVKEFYHEYMNYRCGFGIPVKAPKIE